VPIIALWSYLNIYLLVRCTLKIQQSYWTQSEGWDTTPNATSDFNPQLVFIFASTAILSNHQHFEKIQSYYPDAYLVGCSTAGEICDTRVRDESISLTAVSFEKTKIKQAVHRVQNKADSYPVGKALAQQLLTDDLVHVFILSDGLTVNGTELVRGFSETLPDHVVVTGGLSGDGDRFQQTLICANDKPSEDSIVAIGFYGQHLKVGFGSLGGWDPFGPQRKVTKSSGNILYELDNHSALELYKQYLGKHAEGLPATGLLFPLALRTPNSTDQGIVRTILSIDEKSQSMTFAGDIPENSTVQLMKANFDRLIDGATDAAHLTQVNLNTSPQLAILISCVGRKLVLKQRIEEEVEGVRDVLGDNTILTGFYSYGEISPHTPTARCELHNQTMTITTFTED